MRWMIVRPYVHTPTLICLSFIFNQFQLFLRWVRYWDRHECIHMRHIIRAHMSVQSTCCFAIMRTVRDTYLGCGLQIRLLLIKDASSFINIHKRRIRCSRNDHPLCICWYGGA